MRIGPARRTSRLTAVTIIGLPMASPRQTPGCRVPETPLSASFSSPSASASFGSRPPQLDFGVGARLTVVPADPALLASRLRSRSGALDSAAEFPSCARADWGRRRLRRLIVVSRGPERLGRGRRRQASCRACGVLALGPPRSSTRRSASLARLVPRRLHDRAVAGALSSSSNGPASRQGRSWASTTLRRSRPSRSSSGSAPLRAPPARPVPVVAGIVGRARDHARRIGREPRSASTSRPRR